jgi:hypothetical protein
MWGLPTDLSSAQATSDAKLLNDGDVEPDAQPMARLFVECAREIARPLAKVRQNICGNHIRSPSGHERLSKHVCAGDSFPRKRSFRPLPHGWATM